MNPAVVCPESRLVQAGFMRDDLFVCVHEQFMTDTAKLADIVLPATTFLEHDDMYRAGGHSFFQVTKKVIEPYAEARENHYVICELAKRLGAQHRGFNMTAWEIIDETLKVSGYPDAETLHRDHWLDRQPDFDKAHFTHGFPTRDGKFHFKPDWSARGKYHAQMPRAARPHGKHRARGRTTSVPSRHRTRAQLSQHHVHRNPDLAQTRKPADRADTSGRLRRVEYRERRARSRSATRAVLSSCTQKRSTACSAASSSSNRSGRIPRSMAASASTPSSAPIPARRTAARCFTTARCG